MTAPLSTPQQPQELPLTEPQQWQQEEPQQQPREERLERQHIMSIPQYFDWQGAGRLTVPYPTGQYTQGMPGREPRDAQFLLPESKQAV